jgi:hypothetical protein
VEDPFDSLNKIFSSGDVALEPPAERTEDHIFLPLYATKSGGEKVVSEKSALNQWNASGRSRKLEEVYIPIPAWVHREYEGFFPPKDQTFNLKRPDGVVMSVKLCQQNSKALMSNPNTALGDWLLRKVLDLKEGELLTYEKLEEIGIDSVVVYKISEGNYEIEFAKLGSFEDFKQKSLIDNNDDKEDR